MTSLFQKLVLLPGGRRHSTPQDGPHTAAPRTIGHTAQGRPIHVLYRGAETARLRVLIVAGQHGDEPLARAAARRFVAAFDVDRFPDLQVAVVPDLNPDGSAGGTRTSAAGHDLNRDHLLLQSEETQVLHRFVRTWRPHLVVDVHTYPPRRKHLLRQGLVYCHDVFLDVPTNPSAAHPLRGAEQMCFLMPVAGRLSRQGYRSARYTLVNASGRVRHSTPDVTDLRNGIAMRYGVFTVLVEGRQPPRRAPREKQQRTLAALVAALHGVVQWAASYQTYLLLPAPPLTQEARVPVRSRYRRAEHGRRMAFYDTAAGAVREVALPGPYTPAVQVTQHATLPRAYAVPRTATALLEVLDRHGFTRVAGMGRQRVEMHRIDDVRPSNNPRRAPRRLEVTRQAALRVLDDYVVFPVDAQGGRALAVLLEPASKYGLHRFADVGLPLTSGEPYPVLRVL